MTRLEWNSTAAQAAIARAVEATIRQTGAVVEAETKRELDRLVYSAPPARSGYRRTGNLIASVRHRVVAPNEVRIEVTAEYAAYVHEGTRHTQPRPFLANAAQTDRPRLIDRLAANLRKELT